MAEARDKTDQKAKFNGSSLSPDLRQCLARLETLEAEVAEFERYLAIPVDKQREAWRIVDGR